ncbi:unnamed protein product [Durusdinium trenchii]|uniref:WWE domain-containing protein n=1 Tax=Durusdinium trenchii TaxID=1381693 RepID=A0ABP0JIY0_9DINO
MDGVWVYYEVSSAPCWKAFSRLDQSRLEDARAEAACTTGDGAEDDGEEEEASPPLQPLPDLPAAHPSAVVFFGRAESSCSVPVAAAGCCGNATAAGCWSGTGHFM